MLRKTVLRLALLGLGATPVGCVGPNVDSLRTRAAFDLECPETEIQTQQLSTEVYGVTGCGKRATYVNGPRNWDDWILNSDGVEGGEEK